MKQLAPIILFAYNRPVHTRKTIDALKRNVLAQESDLYIFADGPKAGASDEQYKNIQKVRDYLPTISGFKSVNIEVSPKNKGLAKSIIYGVTKIVNQYGRVIVLEDDIITSSHYLQYINQSLELYEGENDVICINGLSIIKDAPISANSYFQYGADCQAWGTWKRGWDLLNLDTQELQRTLLRNRTLRKEFTYNGSYPYMELLQAQIDGRIDSWAICWYATAVIKRKLCLYPSKSLVQNIGYDATGTHTKNSNTYEACILADESVTDFPKIPVNESQIMRKEWERLFREINRKPFSERWRLYKWRLTSTTSSIFRKIGSIIGICKY